MATNIAREEFANLFQSFATSAFRLETLNAYTVPSEASDYSRFLAGEELPISVGVEWAQMVQKRITEGKKMQRVHLVTMPLTSYLKFEVEWGYVHSSAAGEQIYLLDRTKVPPQIQTMTTTDFWLFDQKTLVVMQYDSTGRFLTPQKEDSPSIIAAYRDISDTLLSIAIPLKIFLKDTRTA
jgi:hypothetical protein